MRTVRVVSDSRNVREYETELEGMDAITAEFGRCDGGEVVDVIEDGATVAEYRWTPEDGGHYFEALVVPE